MSWEIDLIKRFQSIGGKALDFVMYGMTLAGEELFFIIVTAFIYWCVSKRFGFKFVNVFMLGQLAIGAVKAIVKRPRPYTLDGIESIREKTDGWSFPSGHSHNMANMTSQISAKLKNRKKPFIAAIITGTILTLCVAVSRVYLGQHYPTDVVAGIAFGVLTGLVGGMLFELLKDKEEVIMYVALPLSIMIGAIMLFVGDAASNETVIKLCGAYGAVTLGYFIEKRFVKYEMSKPVWWKILFKCLIGFVVLIGIKEGFKALFEVMLDGGRLYVFLNGYIRYFLIGAWAILGCPVVFKVIKI